MQIKWDIKAQNSFLQISLYIQEKFGTKARRNFVKKVRDVEAMLKDNPSIGKLETLFSDRTTTYRSLVVDKLSKIIYYATEQEIRIALMWDTRQEPEAQASKLKDKD
ncbi:MAG: type II toxin-antitoxin system RelE/ParE family toxin [Paludibacteraceae bacterium]|nr:type II toxin-antitoxin system RelE/ParE family toxin [Paludibacteraceae bacterium]MBQ2065508.1 type II toxin-antitoxin system RelE/ParE family toxin [Paludibacteraceae bacterium]MBQ3930320.1 type II toxin-antitoxin system RelE/ParE family toxin [Paludibacteraceae bacterium]MBQ4032992.1 type II toxin-antitoxin system RelE/ParE family toxin [Paludibacteraceae bacterium]